MLKLVTSVAIAATLASAGTAAAAGWSIHRLPNPTPKKVAYLDGVSCASTKACTAVGVSGLGALAEHSNGRQWLIQALPRLKGSKKTAFNAVSCPSARYCVAVGGDRANTLAERWNGSRWSVLRTPRTRGSLSAVSCPSRRWCEAVGSGLAERWNGSHWSTQQLPANPMDDVLAGVSCTSSTDCTMVGSQYNSPGQCWPSPLIEHWNGQRWSLESFPGTCFFEDLLHGVSCASSRLCVAVGENDGSGGPYGFELVWNGVSWSERDNVDPLSAVSCHAGACTATGDYVHVENWNGSTWRQSANINADLAAVSCPSASACFAVGSPDSTNGLTPMMARGP